MTLVTLFLTLVTLVTLVLTRLTLLCFAYFEIGLGQTGQNEGHEGHEGQKEGQEGQKEDQKVGSGGSESRVRRVNFFFRNYIIKIFEIAEIIHFQIKKSTQFSFSKINNSFASIRLLRRGPPPRPETSMGGHGDRAEYKPNLGLTFR